MNRIVLDSAHHPPLEGISVELGSGIHLMSGTDRDGTAALIDLCAGLVRAKRGRVSINDTDPYGSPSLRACLASLPADPQILPLASAADFVGFVGGSRGLRSSADSVLSEWGVAHLGPRDPRTLSKEERRTLTLAVQLEQPAPPAVVLFEPLTTLLDPVRVARRLTELALAGSVVLVTTVEVDPPGIIGRRWILARGRLYPRATLHQEALPRLPLVVTARDPRPLAQFLLTDPRVSGCSLNPGFPTMLRVWATDFSTASRAVVDAALASETDLLQITAAPPSLFELQTTAHLVPETSADTRSGP